MGENWLATLGSWFATPAKAAAKPWWDKLVDQKAEDSAVRLRLLDAVIRFRVSDFAKGRSIDTDKAVGIAKKVMDRLKPRVSATAELDVTGAEFLKQVENEIQYGGVPLTSWVQLACLAATRRLDPRQYVAVDFVEDNGRHSHGGVLTAALASAFPFWEKLFVLDGQQSATLSPEAMAGLTEYVARVTLPEAKYAINVAMPDPGVSLTVTLTSILPKAWKPSS